MVHIAPKQQEIGEIFEERLKLAAKIIDLPAADIYNLFFEKEVAQIPGTTEVRPWREFIVRRSRERPRDALQLLWALAKSALDRESKNISDGDLAAVMPPFSAARVTYLTQEVGGEANFIEQVMNFLAKANYDAGTYASTAENLRKILKTFPSSMSAQLYSRSLKPDDDYDAIALWKFLFENSVLNARISDSTAKREFAHVSPRERPQLVSAGNWNEMQGMIWEINPAYIDYMNTIRRKHELSTGLAIKRPRRR